MTSVSMLSLLDCNINILICSIFYMINLSLVTKNYIVLYQHHTTCNDNETGSNFGVAMATLCGCQNLEHGLQVCSNFSLSYTSYLGKVFLHFGLYMLHVYFKNSATPVSMRVSNDRKLQIKFWIT